MLEEYISHSLNWNKKLLHDMLGPESNSKKRDRDQNFTKQIEISLYSLANLYKRRAFEFCMVVIFFAYLAFNLEDTRGEQY